MPILNINKKRRTNGKSPQVPYLLDLTASLKDAKILCILPAQLFSSQNYKKLILVTLKVKLWQQLSYKYMMNSKKQLMSLWPSTMTLWTLKKEDLTMISINSDKELKS